MPSYLDLAVFTFVALSTLLAMLRGFNRTLISILPWVASALVAYFFYPLAVPFINPYISKIETASALALATIFFATLIITSLVTVLLSRVMLNSSVSNRDRMLGFVYGALRGIVLAIIAFGFYAWLVPESEQPLWVSNAYTKPILQSCIEALRTYVPDNLDSVIAKIRAKIVVPVSNTNSVEVKSEIDPSKPAVDALTTTPIPESSIVEMKPAKAPFELTPVPAPTNSLASPVEAKPELPPSEATVVAPSNEQSGKTPLDDKTLGKTMPESTAASPMTTPATSPLETKPIGKQN